MIEFKESKFYKLLQDFFINNDKESFIQFLAEFYNKTEGIIVKNEMQDEIIKELREMFLLFNEEGIDENIVREKVNYFVENNEKIQDIITKIIKNTNKIKNITSQLETIETKLLNPEMFRFQDELEVDDQTALNSAIDYASENNIELHLYKDYIIDKLSLNKNLIIVSHNVKLTNKSEQEIFIEISSNSNVKIKGTISVICDKCNIGVLNNDSAFSIEHIIIEGAKNKNVEYRKTSTYGYGDIDFIESSLSPIGLHLNTTDVKVKRYQGFCCLTHIQNSGGGNFIENAHGWGLKDTTYGDWVTGSTMLELTGGSCVITNLYADTTENAIKLPNDNHYTLISITNLTYFLNRTYYPDGINRPYLFKNIENFKGQLSCTNIQADNSAWRDSSGQQVELIPYVIDDTRITINGVCNNGYLDTKNALTVQKGDLYNYLSNESSYYFSPYNRKYYMYKKQKNILFECSMTRAIPNNEVAYSVTLNEPFNDISLPCLSNAYIYDNGNVTPMVVKMDNGSLVVTNKSGSTVSSGSLHINIQSTNFY